MKVAVSIPQDIFTKAERFVRETGRSRSEVYASAVQEYVARHAADDITAALDRVVKASPGDGAAFVDAAARRALESVEW